MPAAELDVEIEIGSEWELEIEYESDGDPVLLDTDDYDARLQVRTSYDSDDTLLDLSNGDGITLTDGLIAVAVSALDTAVLTPQNAVWDLKVLPGGIESLAKRLVRGRAVITPQSTQ